MMSQSRSFFALIAIVVVMAVALTVPANAQLGRKAPAKPSASTAAPQPPVLNPNQTPPATPALTPEPVQTVPGLTADEVKRIIQDKIDDLPKAPRAEDITRDVVRQVDGQVFTMTAQQSYWNYGLAGGGLLLLAVAFIILYRRIPKWDAIKEAASDISDQQVKGLKKIVKRLAERLEVVWAQIDPDGAKADRISELREAIASLEDQEERFSAAKRHEEAAEVAKQRETLQRELDELTAERPRTGRGSRGLGLTAIIFAFALTAHTVSAATPTCYNSETGKTPGSQKVAVAVVGSANTFTCSVSGKVVELVEVDDPKTVVLTPNVSSENPLTFDFTPTVEQRLLVKVDGKVFNNQIAVRSQAIAEGINDAIDLAGSGGSNSDLSVRLVLEGLACGNPAKPECVEKFRKDAWGSRKGSSSEAGASIRASIVDATLGDPRLREAFSAALSSFAANLPAPPAPVVVSDDHIREVADGVVAPLRSDISLASRVATSAAKQASDVGDLALTTASVVGNIKNGHFLIGGRGLSDEDRKKCAEAVELYYQRHPEKRSVGSVAVAKAEGKAASTSKHQTYDERSKTIRMTPEPKPPQQ